jgi:hypothetical protein
LRALDGRAQSHVLDRMACRGHPSAGDHRQPTRHAVRAAGAHAPSRSPRTAPSRHTGDGARVALEDAVELGLERYGAGDAGFPPAVLWRKGSFGHAQCRRQSVCRTHAHGCHVLSEGNMNGLRPRLPRPWLRPVAASFRHGSISSSLVGPRLDQLKCGCEAHLTGRMQPITFWTAAIAARRLATLSRQIRELDRGLQ